MKAFLPAFILLLLPFINNAQNASIAGQLLDENQAGVPFASLILYSAIDSSMVKGTVTTNDGNYLFDRLAAGSYWLQTSYVGYTDYQSEIFNLAEGEKKQLPNITINPASTELEAITVVARRPIIETLPDKTVFNVEGSINAQGNNAIELLRKSPGVVVDNNDNISLAGKSGVRIYIDGKQSPLRGEDLAAYLRSVGSEQIDKIEIITNPSAKYDAEGNAGIIDIRFKKDKRLGTNATISAGYGIGETQIYNGNISANYRNKKANIFASYGYGRYGWLFFMSGIRTQFGGQYENSLRSVGNPHVHNFKVGTDYFINDKQTIGFLVTGNSRNDEPTSDSETIISLQNSENIDSVLVSDTRDDNQRQNYTFNLNYMYNIDKEKSLTMDVDYGMFRNDGYQYQPNFYYDADMETLKSERIFSNETPSNIDIYTFKADYEQPALKGKIGVGIKTAYVQTDNTFNFYNFINKEEVIDVDRSSNFVYTENVNAAYGSYQRKFKKWDLQLGLRLEQTNSKGDLTALDPTQDKITKRTYFDYFPSGGLTYNINRTNSMRFNYSRRIQRPNYETLNPFQDKMDELNFQEGNPFLTPEYSNNFQLSHTFKYMYTTSFNFSHTKDLITRIVNTSLVPGEEGISILTWENLARQYSYSLTFSAPWQIKKWWSSFTNVTGFHLRNRAEQNERIQNVNINVTSMSFYTQHTFNLPWDLKFEVSGWYSSPAIWGGIYETDHMWSMDAGVQRKFLDGRGNIKFSVSDIFHTAQWRAFSDYGNAVENVTGGWDSRRFKVNMSYTFGNQQVKSRKRKTGLEDESKRTSGGGQGRQ